MEEALMLPSSTPRKDTISGLNERVRANGAAFESLPRVGIRAHGYRLRSSEDQETVTVYTLVAVAIIPTLDQKKTFPFRAKSPFFAKRSFRPPQVLINGRLGLKKIANDFKEFIKTIRNEFGGYHSPLIQGSPNRFHEPVKRGGAPCIM
jgi:hypothetical protein